MELETKQKEIKQINAEDHTENELEKEKNGAAKITRFLVHCFGLQANIRSFKLFS